MCRSNGSFRSATSTKNTYHTSDTSWHKYCLYKYETNVRKRSKMKKAYFLISHNEFAYGLKKAVEMIVGKQENLTAYGLMPGDHPDNIVAKIEEQITEDMEVVILGDIAGGSVCNSALVLTTRPNVVLVSGTNLPLAMEIIVTQTTDKEAIEAIIASVREGIKMLKVQPMMGEDCDDFF